MKKIAIILIIAILIAPFGVIGEDVLSGNVTSDSTTDLKSSDAPPEFDNAALNDSTTDDSTPSSDNDRNSTGSDTASNSTQDLGDIVQDGNETIDNVPIASITSPTEGAVFGQGESITFTGSGTDPEDGDLNGSALQWTSDRDGELGYGCSFTSSDLSVGNHTITLIATDNGGLNGNAWVTIIVCEFNVDNETLNESPSDPIPSNDTDSNNTSNSTDNTESDPASNSTQGLDDVQLDGNETTTNLAPSAYITSPPEGEEFIQGEAITFIGSGTDPEEGELTGSALQWTSDRDGEIGYGCSFTSSNLSVGNHTITLTATDSGGLNGNAWVTISITREVPLFRPLDYGSGEDPTFYVNTSGWWCEGGAFNESNTPIQSAIDNANDGDTIMVYSGTYYENVNVYKQLTLLGIDDGGGMPVVDASGTGSAITLSADGIILDGFFATNSSGIFLEDAGITVLSNKNILVNNTANFNNNYGFFLNYYSNNNTLINNTANSNNKDGIYLHGFSNNNTLINNTANSNYEFGIHIDESSNNTLFNNTANLNNWSGIHLWYSSNNTLAENNASLNWDWSPYGYRGYGIYLDYSNKNILIHNTANSNSNYGIFLDYSSDNNALTNNAANLNFIGIYVYGPDNNTLVNNTASSNYWRGIQIQYSSNNTISENNASSNGNDGILVIDSSNNNTLRNNTVNSNGWGGIRLGDGGDPTRNVTGNRVIGNNASYNVDDGIGLEWSEWNNVTDNVVYQNGAEGISVWHSNHSLIINNNATNNTLAGIGLRDAHSNNLINNTASNNFGMGIVIDAHSSNNNISNNTASNNTLDGILVGEESNNNTLNNNTISNNDEDGIYLEWSSNNTIIDNIVSDNGQIGIYLNYFSNSNIITNNNISKSLDGAGIGLENCSNNSISSNDIFSNAYEGIYLLNSSNNTISSNNIRSNNNDGIYLVGFSSNNTIIKNTVKLNDAGISLDYSDSNNITSNIVNSNRYHGIYLDGSSNNLIINNTANFNNESGILLEYSSNNNQIVNNTANSNNETGIYLNLSNYNQLINNTFSENGQHGIWLRRSSYNTLRENDLDHNYNINLACKDSPDVEWWNNDIDTSNTVNGAPIYKFYKINDTIIEGLSTKKLYLVGCNNITIRNINYSDGDPMGLIFTNDSLVENCTVTDNNAGGFLLIWSHNNTLANNSAINHLGRGFWLQESTNNTLTKNIIRGNGEGGVDLRSSSSNNLIYNNYFDNTNNAYDNGNNIWNITQQPETNIIGGPNLGGNYWSNYTGMDTNGDGLGETPYDIPGGSNRDYLPLVPSALILQFHLDEGTGTVATDTSGYGNNGTIHGATWTTGISGNALAFDGVDDYIDCGNDASLDITGAVTIESWVKTSSLQGDQTIVEKGGWDWAGQGEYGLLINEYPSYTGKGRFQIYDVEPRYIDTTDVVNDGRWHHLVGTWDGSEIKIYLDGRLETSANTTGTYTPDTEHLFIGSRYGTSYFFNGLIDEVRIYNRALTESEIQALYNAHAPYAEFSIDRNFCVGTRNDSITNGTYDSDLRYWMDIYNDDDDSDTILGNLTFNVYAENITDVDWREYAEWNKSSAEWRFPFVIKENERFGTGFGTNFSEPKYLNLDINRWFNQTAFNEPGYQLVNFSVKFENTDFEWVWGNVGAYEHDEVYASIVPGTFETDATMDWIGEREHLIQFEFNESNLQTGVTYNFSFVVKLEPTMPVLYKPSITIGQGLYRNSTMGEVGNTAEMPSYMLPENVSYASVTTNISNGWRFGRFNHLIAGLGEIVMPAGPYARFSIHRNFDVHTQGDIITSGIYDTYRGYHLEIFNEDDDSDTTLGNLTFIVHGENITNVDWREYAEWNESSAEWQFPPEFTIEENKGFGTGLSTNFSELKYLNLNITRWFNRTTFNEPAYQLVNFSVEFEDENFEWLWGSVSANEHEEVYASIVPGTFETDAPLEGVDGEEHWLHFDINESALQSGRTYNFSFVVKVDPRRPVIYKPDITIGEGLYHNSTIGEIELMAEMPPYLLPENVSYASVTTNMSNAWRLERVNHLIAGLGEVVMPTGPYAKFEFNKDFNVRTESDTITSGFYECPFRYGMGIHNEEDDSDTILGDLGFYARADNITEVDWEVYATWNQSQVNWSFPPKFVIAEDDWLWTNFKTNYTETRYLNVNTSRWMNQTIFSSSDYQLAKFTVTFANKDFQWLWAKIEANDHHEIEASIVPGTLTYDAPLDNFNEWEHGIHFNFDKERIEPGVTYNFSIIVKVTPTGNEAPPILYKPRFSVGEGVYYNSTTGSGYKIEIPQEMLPENVSYASASTNVSSAWLIKRHYHTIAGLDEVVELPGPHALFSADKSFPVVTENDTIPSGIYEGNLWCGLNIQNSDDTRDTVLGELRFNAQADNITGVRWEEHAVWNKTSVSWTFPSDFVIYEDEWFGTGFATNRTEVRHLNIDLSREMNRTLFNESAYQLANFTVTFGDTNFQWCGGRIEAKEYYEVIAMIVPGTFSTDAPLEWINELEHLVNFGFYKDAIKPGVPYNFSVVIKVNLTGNVADPIVYKPLVHINMEHEYSFAPGGEGFEVEAPPEMLPRYVHNASVRTNISNNWALRHVNRTIAMLNEVCMPKRIDITLSNHTVQYGTVAPGESNTSMNITVWNNGTVNENFYIRGDDAYYLLDRNVTWRLAAFSDTNIFMHEFFNGTSWYYLSNETENLLASYVPVGENATYTLRITLPSLISTPGEYTTNVTIMATEAS